MTQNLIFLFNIPFDFRKFLYMMLYDNTHDCYLLHRIYENSKRQVPDEFYILLVFFDYY